MHFCRALTKKMLVIDITPAKGTVIHGMEVSTGYSRSVVSGVTHLIMCDAIVPVTSGVCNPPPLSLLHHLMYLFLFPWEDPPTPFILR